MVNLSTMETFVYQVTPESETRNLPICLRGRKFWTYFEVSATQVVPLRYDSVA